MSAIRIVGIILIVVGIAVLVQGGIFWTERDTIVDAGPLEVTTESREGMPLSPVLGAIALIGGIVLLVVPRRPRA